MGIFRMYTGDDGQSIMEELKEDDPILETLKTCTGCSIQMNSRCRSSKGQTWITWFSGPKSVCQKAPNLECFSR